MKWTVQRYVLREVVQTWLAVTGVLVAILVSNQLSRVLGQAADNDYGRHVVFDLIALGAIMNLSVIVPVGLLLAIVLALGRLYHDSEMAALQACGFAPARLLVPLFCFAAVIAVGLGWLAFFQVPRADQEAQLLRRSALKEAQFGQLDAGRFRSFISGGGDAVFYAERVDEDGLLHNVFVRRETAGRIEVALADTATYSRAAANGMHFVTLFNGRRYEGVPGRSDFRVIEFREHGIPVVTPGDPVGGPQDPDTKPTRELLGSSCSFRYRPAAIQGIESHHGAGIDPGSRSLEPPAPAAGPLRPRRIRHRRLFRVFEFAVCGQSLGGERRSAARDRRLVGSHRHLGAGAISRISRSENRVNTLDRYLYRTVMVYTLMVMGVLLTLGALFVFISQQSDIGVGDYNAADAFLFTFLNLPQQAFELLAYRRHDRRADGAG